MPAAQDTDRQAPAAATSSVEPLASSQAANVTSASDNTSGLSEESNKRLKMDHDGAASAQPAAAPSPYMLPVELLSHIFLYLKTSDVALLARVCKRWQAASTDSRIWRHLSFGEVKGVVDLYGVNQLQVKHFKSMGARSGNTIESLDLANLPQESSKILAKVAVQSAATLKHLYSDEALESLKLAKLCPQLETLKVRTIEDCLLRDLILKNSLLPQPRYFSLACGFFNYRWGGLNELSDGDVLLFDHATTIEFTLIMPLPHLVIISPTVFERILANPVVENLIIHGLYGGYGGLAGSLTAPSLTHLDLRWSHYWATNGHQLNAPNLRSLAIDAHLTSLLTPASVDLLSSLTLRLVGINPDRFDQSELDGTKRFEEYQGSLKLQVGCLYTEVVLKLLSRGFLWPGLEKVEIELTQHAVSALIAVIAAREAGARGASAEQYLETISDTSTRLLANQPRRMTRALKAVYEQEARNALASACAFQLDAGREPICRQVHWKVKALENVPAEILDLLEEQPYIDIERLSDA